MVIRDRKMQTDCKQSLEVGNFQVVLAIVFDFDVFNG